MKNLFKALAEFQQEVPTIHKGTQGYGYSYADLPKIFEVINPLLKKHGLGFTQLLDSKENGNYLTTVLFHQESGETLESSTLIPNVPLKGMNDYQSYGSGVTYFRRYTLASMLGLVTDKDTDASGEQVKQEVTTEPEKKSLTDERFTKALEKIQAGTYTVDKLTAAFALTEAQLQTLKDNGLC